MRERSFAHMWGKIKEKTKKKLAQRLGLSAVKNAEAAHRAIISDQFETSISTTIVGHWFGEVLVESLTRGDFRNALMNKPTSDRLSELAAKASTLSPQDQERLKSPPLEGELKMLFEALVNATFQRKEGYQLKDLGKYFYQMNHQPPLEAEPPIAADPPSPTSLDELLRATSTGSTLAPIAASTLTYIANCQGAPEADDTKGTGELDSAEEGAQATPRWAREVADLYARSQDLSRRAREAVEQLKLNGLAFSDDLEEEMRAYRAELERAVSAARAELPEDLLGECTDHTMSVRALSQLKRLSTRARCRELLHAPIERLEELCALETLRPIKSFEVACASAIEWLKTADELSRGSDLEEAESHAQEALAFEALLELVLGGGAPEVEGEALDDHSARCELVAARFGVALLTSLHLIGPRAVDVEQLLKDQAQLREERLYLDEALREACEFNDYLCDEIDPREQGGPLTADPEDQGPSEGEELTQAQPLHPETPEACLRSLAERFPDRVEVLESAYRSAQGVSHFRRTALLWHLLYKLATRYVELMRQGGAGGDVRARAEIFGASHFSPNESEQTSHNGRSLMERTFTYQGRDVVMMRHLKIGKKNNTASSIRVHFEWVPEEGRVVIGHCGGHLYLKSYD